MVPTLRREMLRKNVPRAVSEASAWTRMAALIYARNREKTEACSHLTAAGRQGPHENVGNNIYETLHSNWGASQGLACEFGISG